MKFLLPLLLGIHLLGIMELRGANDRPSVLFLAIDDLRPELGCYGVEHVHSPQIDRLAAEGVRFDAAHCQIAVCNPSRVSLLTGLRPDSAKVWTLDVRFRHTIPEAVTLPQYFQRHGYTTLGFGKIFHNPWPDNVSWSEPHAWPKNARLWSEEAKRGLAEFKAKQRADGVPQRKIDRLRATAAEIVDLADSEHTDGAIADQALAAMRRLAKEEKPFFLAAGFVRPHLPFVVPRKYWDLYDRDAIPLSGETSLPENAPRFAMNTMYELRDYFDFLETPDPLSGSLTEAQQRKLKHGYLASVSFIDAQVGRLLEELEKQGLADDTIVVLWSDHGFKLGEHNSWCKQTNHEIDTRVPLIIRDPRAKGNGAASHSLVELVDLYPTLCDLAGLPVAKTLEGVSLRPVLDDPEASVKPRAVSQFLRRHQDRELMGYALRTERWRYIEWIDLETTKPIARELYDHRSDPGERVSLAEDPAHADTLAKLGRELRAALPHPPGALPARERPGQLAARQAKGEKPKPAARPKITFRNESETPVAVSWLPPGRRKPKLSGKLAPGESMTRLTTKGHRFRLEGEGIDRTVTVTQNGETIRIGAPKTPPDPQADVPPKLADDAPNIVVIMADDWSWPHASILGDGTVRTPNFDRIAREGVLFENAFTPVPSCTPARHVTASGQAPWRLGEGIDLGSSLADDVPVYPDRLAAGGYRTGFSRKGTAPSSHTHRGNDPFGPRYRNFGAFLEGRESGQPFSYWYGAGEPHRPFSWRASLASDLDLETIETPPFLPGNDTTRIDLGDYYLKVEQLDRFAGEILARLEKEGELENTLLVMTSDNGMAFPRAKATLYDAGTRVPLAIRWGAKVTGGRRVSDFVTLADLAPTFLDAAGLPVAEAMTGRSLLPVLLSESEGALDSDQDHVLLGMERHVYPHPARAIRTEDFLYLRNFAPETWPTGKAQGGEPTYDFAETPWPTTKGAFSHNIDPGPTKQWMRHHESPQDAQAFGRRPAEELYDLRKDPHQLDNLLAGRTTPEEVATIRRELSDRLTRELREQGDPRFAEPDHATFSMHGWTLHLADRLWSEQADATRRMLELLDGQLERVVEAVPEPALARVRRIPIWLNPPYEGKRGTAEYHPRRGWLEKNGRNPAMARAIEITNVRAFPFENRRMPYLLLHELAHGYHDRVLPGGYGNATVREAFERARESGVYDEVDRFDGKKIRKDKAYALSNPMEYFAESSEAYFGKNDFFPFNRDELKEHDPEMHDLVRKLWNALEPR